MNQLIHIILPIHNRRETTRLFIQGLSSQSYQNFSLVVIDDGSTDGSFEMIKEVIPAAIHIKGNGNWWWGGSLQQGYHWLRKNASLKDAILFMNDDSHIDKDFLQTGIEILKDHSKTLLLAEAFSMQTNKLIDKGVVFDFKNYSIQMPKLEEEINCLSTRGLFLQVSDLMELKGFRNILLPHYYSDYEFTIRAKRKGFNLMVSYKLKLLMNEQSTGTEIINYKNRSDFFKQYFSKRYNGHPVYTFNFIMLTFPFPYKIKFAWRHLKSSVKTVIKVLLNYPLPN